MNPKLAELRKKAMALPLSPGVYLMKNADGQIIYIGKAKMLKNRVSQYFGSQNHHNAKVRRMVANVDHFDYILTDSEFEALVLECSLIKLHTPKYNILLKDDKGYSYIRISPPPYSRITVAFQKEDDGARYIGPYTSSWVVKQSVDEAVRAFRLPTCSRRFPQDIGRARPCLNASIRLCCAPCRRGVMSAAEYQEVVDEAVQFLTGSSAQSIRILTQKMGQAAEELQFERAAQLRDRISALKRLGERQTVVSCRTESQDVIALAQGSGTAVFAVQRFTAHRLSDQEIFPVGELDELPQARADFVQQYYSMRDRVPPLILLDGEIEDPALLEEWLSKKAGRSVHLWAPKRGDLLQAVQRCAQNAAEQLAQRTGATGSVTAALNELGRLLGLPQPPHYIESYDISNLAGENNVAGMVVFENGRPLKSAYRKFQIRTVSGQDDYGSMREVMVRRFAEYEKCKETHEGFGRMPDLILLDGGRGHVSAVKPLLRRMGYDVPVFGMVKDDRHRTRAIAQDGGEIVLRSNRSAFTLVSSIQDEVHRFAIGYHHKRRTITAFSSELLQIPTVGKKRAEQLWKHFGRIDALRSATVEELLLVPDMTRPSAEAVYAYFHRSPENAENS